MSLKDPSFLSSPIDHFLQQEILLKLYIAGSALSFSDLKPDTIENSLFMYHIRKLESRDILERTQEGYVLTEKGIRWVNFIGDNLKSATMRPRVLINFFVTNTEKTKVLITRRKGGPAKYLSEYILPGDLHEYAMPVSSAAAAILTRITGEELPLTYLSTVEVIHGSDTTMPHHVIMFLHEATMPERKLKEAELFSYEWIDLEKLTDAQVFHTLIPVLLQKYRNKEFKEFESLVLD